MTYYLICDPITGKVKRRSRQPAKHGEGHLFSFAVEKNVWKDYRAGDQVKSTDVPCDKLDQWLRATSSYQLRESVKDRFSIHEFLNCLDLL